MVKSEIVRDNTIAMCKENTAIRWLNINSIFLKKSTSMSNIHEQVQFVKVGSLFVPSVQTMKVVVNLFLINPIIIGY